ncbi:hypothetical protein HNP46_006570 [Pseudomonas nitritireducens]|uniref:4-aminobutyrate aminotransferase n=1 Tax=Pseudomonas nitroreducens TaxID=46680 RepID=A0A7W7P4F0_PSENT|nr:DUF5682 family protein [Pseudomonas nitritireducens]MBB4867651.1 hypothetical protein [Pseudomonas nitritireducens]
MTEGLANLPTRLHAARQQREVLAEQGLHFAPLRHHSPACAFALRSLLEELRPAAVLIEGPADFDALIPDLLDPRSRPPLAILAQRRTAQADSGPQSAFFPFCDYSPEWQALREGHRLGAHLAFIDLPWSCQAEVETDQEHSHSLMTERYLAHSDYLAALAQQAHCRDHDELWEHLFELRSRADLADWRRLFDDTFAWCAMARLDYEDEVLAAEGSLAREAHMLACIQAWRARCDGPLLVVTGGFHTLPLVEALADAATPHQPAPDTQAGHAWLIRYSFDRLDALNGYASGMPSPAYHQRIWDALLDEQAGPLTRQHIATDLLSAIAAQTRAQQLADALTFASVSNAAEQAAGLARLRGHPGPGRYDLLDAIHSCFVKGELGNGQGPFLDAVKKHLGGNRLGDIPSSTLAPPLVEEARCLALQHRLDLSDSLPRRARLDLYRKPRHRERSRFLHLMSYLDSRFAKHQGGPDFINGSGLDLLFEEWEYAWSPVVEARLIECAERGSTLREVALRSLLDEERALQEHGQGRSAGRAVQLLARAGAIGLSDQLPRLYERLAEHLEEDPELTSVVTCGQRLLHLWRGRELLGLDGHAELPALLQRILPSAMFLLPGLEHCPTEQEGAAINALLGLRELLSLGTSQAGLELPEELLPVALERLLPLAPPGLAGALQALRYLDGRCDDAQLTLALQQRFGPGADSEQAVRFLGGLLQAAPELILRAESLAPALNALVAGWDETTFVRHLPDLRLTFTRLKPQETGRLADSLAALNGLGAGVLEHTHYELDSADLLAGAELQLALNRSLERDVLLDWAQEARHD